MMANLNFSQRKGKSKGGFLKAVLIALLIMFVLSCGNASAYTLPTLHTEPVEASTDWVRLANLAVLILIPLWFINYYIRKGQIETLYKNIAALITRQKLR